MKTGDRVLVQAYDQSNFSLDFPMGGAIVGTILYWSGDHAAVRVEGAPVGSKPRVFTWDPDIDGWIGRPPKTKNWNRYTITEAKGGNDGTV